MTYKECWNGIKDVRWLIHIIYRSRRLREDKTVRTGLFAFAIETAGYVRGMSNKLAEMFVDAKQMICSNIMTGIDDRLIERKRKQYVKSMAVRRENAKNAQEYRTYISLMDPNSMRGAYNAYLNVLNFMKRLAGETSSAVCDFRAKMADELREKIGDELGDYEQIEICPMMIREMEECGIYPLYASGEVYAEQTGNEGKNQKGFYDMLEKEENLKWLVYFYFLNGRISENKIRQFVLDVLTKIVEKTGSKRMFEMLGEDFKLIQESILGTASIEAAERTIPNRFMGYNNFGRLWNMIYCGLNYLKYSDIVKAAANGLFFAGQAVKELPKKEGETAEEIIKEIAVDFRKEFGNPYDDFLAVPRISAEAVKCLKKFKYEPVLKDGKWIFRREYDI